MKRKSKKPEVDPVVLAAIDQMATAIEHIASQQREHGAVLGTLRGVWTEIRTLGDVALKVRFAKTDLERNMALSILLEQIAALATRANTQLDGEDEDEACPCSLCMGDRYVVVEGDKLARCPDCAEVEQ